MIRAIRRRDRVVNCLEIRSPEMRKPALEGGPYIRRGRGISVIWTIHELPRNQPYRQAKTLFSLTGGFVPILGPFPGGLRSNPKGESMPATAQIAESSAARAARRCSVPAGALPLDRNAKARIMVYARGLQRQAPPARPASRPADPRLHGGAGGAAVGLPQQPGRPLLPDLREHRRARPSATGIRSMRRSRRWSSPTC